MNADKRGIQPKLRILRHAEEHGHVPKPVDILGSRGPRSIDGARPMRNVVQPV